MLIREGTEVEPTIGILSSACYLPPTTKLVTEVFRDEKIPDVSLAANVDFWNDVGIDKVHLGGDESPSDLGLKAARQALEKAQIDPQEIDLIVDFTSITEDFVAPTWSAAGRVQSELKATRALAIAVNTGGCASFHIALKYACAQMSANPRYCHALLFAGDKTPALNKTYYPITITCDGGSATVLKRNHPRQQILSVEVATLGELHDVWFVPGLGGRRPDEPVSEELLYMRSDMDRFKDGVIKINLFMFRKVMRAALKRIGLGMQDVRYYIYPSFSTWDQHSFCKGLKIDPQTVYTKGLARHGHLQENDMIMNYLDAIEEGFIREGDLIMVTTNGAGFNWGAAVIRY